MGNDIYGLILIESAHRTAKPHRLVLEALPLAILCIFLVLLLVTTWHFHSTYMGQSGEYNNISFFVSLQISGLMSVETL